MKNKGEFLRDEKIIKNTGAIIKKYRRQRKLTLLNLVEKSGIAYMQLWRIENGRINTSISHVARLAQVLSISVDELASVFVLGGGKDGKNK